MLLRMFYGRFWNLVSNDIDLTKFQNLPWNIRRSVRIQDPDRYSYFTVGRIPLRDKTIGSQQRCQGRDS